MRLVSQDDLIFIAKNVNLSLDKTQSLVEEEIDLALLLEHIAKKDFKRNSILHLSFGVFCKLIVFKYATEEPVVDKNYVATTLSNFYTGIRERINVKFLRSSEISEKYSQYLLIFCGFFYDNEFLKLLPSNYLRLMEEGFFRHSHCANVGRNVRKWIKILNRIDCDGWFKP